MKKGRDQDVIRGILDRVSKASRPAEKAWRAAVKRGTPEEIVGGARGYKTYTQRQGTDPKFVCMAVTFLNQDRWLEHAESSNLRMEDVI